MTIFNCLISNCPSLFKQSSSTHITIIITSNQGFIKYPFQSSYHHFTFISSHNQMEYERGCEKRNNGVILIMSFIIQYSYISILQEWIGSHLNQHSNKFQSSIISSSNERRPSILKSQTQSTIPSHPYLTFIWISGWRDRGSIEDDCKQLNSTLELNQT